MSDDESRLDDRWDGEDPAPTDEELRQARELSSAVDRLLAGESVAAPDDLLQASGMIRASFREERLAEERRDELIQQAMRQALGRPATAARRPRLAVASVVALAASLVLVVAAGLIVWSGGPSRRHAPRPELPPQLLSRSSNALMGRPFTDRAGASSRLDLVFADRMNGYRQVVLARGTP